MGVDKALEAKENQMSDEEIEAIGAGDQGMMFGYATNETDEYMPYPIALAQKLALQLTKVRKDGTLTYLRPDGKTQVTVEYDENGKPSRLDAVVLSTQHDPDVTQEQIHADIRKYVFDPILPKEMVDENTKFFVAVCISYAFIEKDIRKIIEKGLSYIPADCEYTRVVRKVMEFYDAHPENWHDCFRYIFENFGYDKYPGICHIIPNIAVMILSLLYGEGDFSRTLSICNMCGWDTDCNVGNVATIMGVRNGLEGIEYEKWRKPINDFLACSSVIGSLNLMDIPFGAVYIAKLAYAVAGEKMPEPWGEIAEKRIDSCHFEFPGSTHAIHVRVDSLDDGGRKKYETSITNTDETAATGNRSLKFVAKPVKPGENIYIYKRTYYQPKDFSDSRYDPSFSPLVYPGQVLHASAYIPVYGDEAQVSLYVKELRSGMIYERKKQELKKGEWKTLEYQIPALEGGLLEEVGICFHVDGAHMGEIDFVGMIDDLYAEGAPDYSVEFAREQEEVWTGLHREISQFTKLKGLMYLEDGELHLSCADFAEAYTGRHDWEAMK